MNKNLKTYSSKNVVNWYAHLNEIISVEKVIFEKNKSVLENAVLLDIGIGGGRTTAYLIDKCLSYTGIDYSQEFVNLTKQKFPDVTISKQDARDLSFFSTASFDFVNFSFNGIDYVDLEGRNKILSEINRILKPGGIFFFSTHNKRHETFNVNPWANKELNFITKLKTFFKLAPFFTKKINNKKNEIIENEYAIINDAAHNYDLMTFYTSPEFLEKQLQDFHFSEIFFIIKKV
jgi:ubiquinone/menaquinone biosynthesis C-methylase UbiE